MLRYGFTRHLHTREVMGLVVAIFLLSCSRPPELPAADDDNGGLFLPDGFGALVVADSTGHARHLAVNENGDIYVKLSSTDRDRGGNIALRDSTGDGKADLIVRFGGKDEKRTSYGTGMLIHNGYLYF